MSFTSRFDIGRFWAEAYRVLKPGGTLAVWGYILPAVKGNAKASQLILDLRFGDQQLGPYWSERRNLVDTEYRDILPPESLFHNVQRAKAVAYTKSNIADFVSSTLDPIILRLDCSLLSVSWAGCRTDLSDMNLLHSNVAIAIQCKSTKSLAHFLLA